MSAALDCLRAARETIADPTRWTQDVMARDAHGHQTFADASDAVCWCAWGAFTHHARAWAIGEPDEAIGEQYLYRAAEELFGDYPSCVNDGEGHPAVLRMYDRAIALAGAEARS